MNVDLPENRSSNESNRNDDKAADERIREEEMLPVELAEYDESTQASWKEVFETCCIHSPQEWGLIFIGVVLVCFFLYFFLLGLELLGTGAKVMTGCRAGTLFGDDTNPIAGVMVGILATVMLQSSSTTTSIVVSLVGSAISVDQGIFMVMGANIGTSVTNTIVAMGQMGDGDELERAFAGATVHDLFNFLTVGVLLPVEVVTGYLDALTGAIVKNAETRDGESWDGPVSKLVDPLAELIIKENKKVINAVAKGDTCDSFYPIKCEDGVESAETCKVALISCISDTNRCPAFFSQDASQKDEIIAGAVCFVLGIFILFVCLGGMVTVLKKMLLGVSARIIYKATDLNPYVSMVVGAGITMIVQSSSITTSILTPLVGVGVLRLETMFPFTLGANIGTTMTALVASLVSDSIESLQVALAHLFFNITGILLWYPIPQLRYLPLEGARFLGRTTRIWRGFPLVYIAVAFFLVPLFFLGLSSLYTQGTVGFTVLGIIITILVALGIAWTFYYCYFKDGKAKTVERFRQRQRRIDAAVSLADDMDAVKSDISDMKGMIRLLMDHTGAPAEDATDLNGNKNLDDDEEKKALVKPESTDEGSNDSGAENISV